MRSITWIVTGFCSLLALPCPALACNLCPGDIRQRLTFRQEAQGTAAQLIVFGTGENPRLTATGGGITDFKIETVIRTHPALGDKKTLEIPRYLAADPAQPTKYLLFCDVVGGKFDFYKGVPVKSATVVNYVKSAAALPANDMSKSLQFYFDYLEHPEKEIAFDAFLEFAKATDKDIGVVAGKFNPAKLRVWLKDPQTPSERLGLYAFLLGSCGTSDDAAFLRSLLDHPTRQHEQVFDGLLGGYIQIRPQPGWDLALATLRDESKSFTQRFAVLRMLRFMHGWKPDENRVRILRALETVVPQGDLADLAIEDLRRWQMWEMTKLVLEQFGKKSHDAPIMRQTIVRYALSCPKPEAVQFVAERRKADPESVKDVEESLQFEKK